MAAKPAKSSRFGDPSGTASRVSAVALLSMQAAPADADAGNGEVLYQALCSQCHGVSGRGDGVNAPHLEVAPRAHTDTAEMCARTDEELAKAIAEGGQAINKSILMPNWGNRLSEQEVDDLVADLRVLCCAE